MIPLVTSNNESALSAQDIPVMKWQEATAYYHILNGTRSSVPWSILWGLFNIVSGTLALSSNPVNLILIALGVLQLGFGVKFLVRPDKAGFLLSGLLLLGIGLWNITVSLVNMSMNSAGSDFNYIVFLYIGIPQTIYGIYRIIEYPKFVKQVHSRPNSALLSACQHIQLILSKTSMELNTRVIQFFCGGEEWTGLFFSQSVFVLKMRSKELMFLSLDNFDIIPNAKTLTYSEINAIFRLRQVKLKGCLTAEALARFSQWKATSGDASNTLTLSVRSVIESEIAPEGRSLQASAAAVVDISVLQWYHYVAAALPFVGLPWGIVIHASKKQGRAGLHLIIMSSLILLFYFCVWLVAYKANN